jgi:hypothetical protein
MNSHDLLDLYTDYLIVNPGGLTTATGLSAMVDNAVSHDKVTRLLNSGKINSATLWETVKPMCHEISSSDAVLVIDDSVEEKIYTDRNDLMCWHFDHTFGRSVKGVNFLTALYHSKEMSLPVGVEFVHKTHPVINKKGKIVYRSKKSKNEMCRELIRHATRNLHFKYVLADCWFSCSATMQYIVEKCRTNFIMGLKDNRRVALSEADKAAGKYVSIKSLKLEGCVMSVYLEQLEFPVLISKQVFKNEDGSTGTLYLVSSDLNLTYEQITTIYQKRWKVEEYHKSVKSNSAFAKSPTQTVQTQTSHFIASILSFVKLERLQSRHDKNHFALKNQLLIQATKAAYRELQKLSTPHIVLN